jgi:carbon monoxide dehydrogenase subunit G
MAELIVNEFTVNRPIEEAWPVLCDVERIAPCLPGAQLQEIEGEIYRGVVKVKLGAVSTQFKGQAHFVERDDDKHTATLRAEGRDTGGRGNAAADIVAEAEALSPTSTRCVVTAELHITGKVAQFGRGIMGDVSKKLMAQFSTNLNQMLDEQTAEQVVTETSGNVTGDVTGTVTGTDETSSAPAPMQTTPPATATATTESAPPAATSDTAAGPAVRKIEGPATEPIDMAGMAGPAILKRLGPVLLGVLLLLVVLRRRRH